MKMLLLLLLPCLCYGQLAPMQDGNSIPISSFMQAVSGVALTTLPDGSFASNGKIERTEYFGDVRFTINQRVITCDTAIWDVRTRTLYAYHVKVKSPSKPVLTCRLLTYDENKDQAIIDGDITFTSKGKRERVMDDHVVFDLMGGVDN